MDMLEHPKADADNTNADYNVPAPVTDHRNGEEENNFQNLADDDDDDDNDQHQPSTATWNAAAVDDDDDDDNEVTGMRVPTPAATDDVPLLSHDNGSGDRFLLPPNIENIDGHRHSNMSRQSTVSSMAGNSIDCDDPLLDDKHIHTVNVTAVPEPEENVDTRFADDRIRNMDDKSIRSDRPDPPPSSDIPMVDENHIGDEIVGHSDPNDITTRNATVDSMANSNDRHNDQTNSSSLTTIISEPQHRHVTTAEETFAEEALASLSNHMAEMTLSEELYPSTDDNSAMLQHILSDPNNGNNQLDIANTEWDLNRPALLAETPNGVTLRKSASMTNHFHVDNSSDMTYHRSLSVPKIYNVPITTSTSTTTATTTYNPDVPTAATADVRHLVGADHLMVLPRVDEGNRFYPPPPPPPSYNNNSNNRSQPDIPPPPPPSNMPIQNHGRRKIRLRLQEEIRKTNPTNLQKKRHTRSTSLLGSIRKSSTRMLRFGGGGGGLSNWDEEDYIENDLDATLSSLKSSLYTIVDRGHLMIGWFDGTSTFELQQHIHKSVLRKLQQLFSVVGDSSNNNSNLTTNNNNIVDIEDLRLLDESYDPPEDVVLSPHIPDGSQFLLRFSTIKAEKAKKNSTQVKMMDYHDGSMTPMSIYSGRAPDSPSAAPSPHFDKNLLHGLTANQLALLNNSLNISTEKPMNRRSSSMNKNQSEQPLQDFTGRVSTTSITDRNSAKETSGKNNSDEANEETSKRVESNGGQLMSEMSSDEDDNADDATMMLHSDDPIEARLREITNLLLLDRKKERYRRFDRQREKRQVVFVVANYFVLFLAIIAISAELQARAPNWIKMMEEHLQNVQNCSENHEALFECVSRGDFAGLIASVVLWLSRSVATKRIFLFGFDTPKKLWTVVYESLVTSVCWGISYLFIRRGMNPDTRPRFVQKYWKDAVYGSLAGFNAAFLKHILKNLIPEQVVEDALRERQLKIMGWLPSFNFR